MRHCQKKKNNHLNVYSGIFNIFLLLSLSLSCVAWWLRRIQLFLVVRFLDAPCWVQAHHFSKHCTFHYRLRLVVDPTRRVSSITWPGPSLHQPRPDHYHHSLTLSRLRKHRSSSQSFVVFFILLASAFLETCSSAVLCNDFHSLKKKYKNLVIYFWPSTEYTVYKTYLEILKYREINKLGMVSGLGEARQI